MKDEGNYGAQLRSEYMAVTDAAVCVGCGLCQDSCFFDARRIENNTLDLAEERCFGCGKCIEACPEKAIRLERQVERGMPIPAIV
jgi:heterodisulfide reductase subunit A-like polyferredoxin